MSGSFHPPGPAYIAKSLFVFIALSTDPQSARERKRERDNEEMEVDIKKEMVFRIPKQIASICANVTEHACAFVGVCLCVVCVNMHL